MAQQSSSGSGFTGFAPSSSSTSLAVVIAVWQCGHSRFPGASLRYVMVGSSPVSSATAPFRSSSESITPPQVSQTNRSRNARSIALQAGQVPPPDGTKIGETADDTRVFDFPADGDNKAGVLRAP